MDMTPMVDVTFLLLIFFMVTAAFSMQKSFEMPKPKQGEERTRAEHQEDEREPVTVEVDQYNTYRVITADWEEEAPSEQELRIRLGEARRGDGQSEISNSLLVKAHVDALHEKVVSAIDAGMEVGMEQVSLLTVEDD